MRLLFVAMSGSIHTARWIDQLAGLGWDLHVYNSQPNVVTPVHPRLRGVTVHGPWGSFRPDAAAAGPRSFLSRRPVLAKLNRAVGTVLWPASPLRRVIRRLRPDLIHSLEIQHSGYLTLDALQSLGTPAPPWIVTNWGSDIYYFGRFPKHRRRIRAVLAACDYYSCETGRDVRLAGEYGFSGTVLLPVQPNTGGFDLPRIAEFRTPGPTSARRLIVLKGYEHRFGRALVGLQAIEQCASSLAGYRVVVYAAGRRVRREIEQVRRRTGLRIEALPYTTRHEDILRLHGQARASIGVSISDGVSTSFLEALVMGSFPIQTHTAAADEWVTHGKTGMIVPSDDPAAIAAALRTAVSDDQLVDVAAAANLRTAQERLDYATIRSRTIEWYRSILQPGRRHPNPMMDGALPGRRAA